jgi:hypothetical protein
MTLQIAAISVGHMSGEMDSPHAFADAAYKDSNISCLQNSYG